LAPNGPAAVWLVLTWLIMTLLVMTWAALTPAQALPRIAFDASLAVQSDHEPGHLPRQLEADLPDLVDNAHPADCDSDAAVPRPFVLVTVAAAAPRDALRLLAVSAALSRSFNPRAPPSLR
jgi:hypothetical protein